MRLSALQTQSSSAESTPEQRHVANKAKKSRYDRSLESKRRAHAVGWSLSFVDASIRCLVRSCGDMALSWRMRGRVEGDTDKPITNVKKGIVPYVVVPYRALPIIIARRLGCCCCFGCCCSAGDDDDDDDVAALRNWQAS